MGWLCLVLVLACSVAACGRPPSGTPAAREARRLRVEPARAWTAAQALLAEQGYEIRRRDREAGVLETDWHAINPEYRATVLVSAQKDRYSDCGKPGLGQAFRGKDVKLRLAVPPSVRKGETAVLVEATFRTLEYLGLPMAVGGARGVVFCRSTGWLEDELALRIQVEALGEHLDRLRRGGGQ